MNSYISEDVAMHNCAEDCWITIHSIVYDLSRLISENRGPLADPLIRFAGQDLSDWFDFPIEPKLSMDNPANIRLPYTPYGRYIHIPPTVPVSNWSTNFGKAWWEDPKYMIGKLTQQARKIKLRNSGTKQDHVICVPCEDCISQIQARYLKYNRHASSYTWKMLKSSKGGKSGSEGAGLEFCRLNMDLTLNENGLLDRDSRDMADAGINEDLYLPTIYLFYNDDLTVA